MSEKKLVKKCRLCKGTGDILKDGELYECHNCDGYGVVFIGYAKGFNPWKKQEIADKILGRTIPKDTYFELARELLCVDSARRLS